MTIVFMNTVSIRRSSSSLASLLAIAGLLLVGSNSLQAEDWPAWRGPRGDGISMETEIPVKWSATENIGWKSPVPGHGLSSPIVLGSKVFLTTGEASDSTRRVLCYDRDSGELLWNTPVHAGPAEKMHRMNSTASSTPATDGERVYALFADENSMQVAAVNLDGKIIWKVSPGSYYSQHGLAACPVVYRDGVIVNGHQDGEAFVVYLDGKTGDERWRYTPAIKLRSFSTPLLFQDAGTDLMILSGASQTVCLKPESGEVVWFAEGPSQKFVCTPAVGHGMVFSFGGSPDKRAMALKLGGKGDVLHTHVAWRSDRSMPYVPTPLLYGDHLHVVNDAGVYSCLNPLTGEIENSNRMLHQTNSSPVAAAGRVYCFCDDGTCKVIANSGKFEELATNELGMTVLTTPAISQGSLFVRTDSHLVRIGRPKLAVNNAVGNNAAGK